MRRSGMVLSVAALTGAFGGTAAAQACIGMPSFDSSAVHLGASAAVASVVSHPTQAYALDGVVGRDHGAFGGISASLEHGARDAWQVQASAGLQSLLPTRAGFELCPIASASNQWWEGIGGAYYSSTDTTVYRIRQDETVQRYSLGLSAGARAPLSETIVATPFVGVAWVGRNANLRYHVTIGAPGGTPQAQGFSDSFGVVRIGTGIGFMPRVVLRAHLNFPFGVRQNTPNGELFDSKFSYGLGVVLAVGR